MSALLAICLLRGDTEVAPTGANIYIVTLYMNIVSCGRDGELFIFNPLGVCDLKIFNFVVQRPFTDSQQLGGVFLHPVG